MIFAGYFNSVIEEIKKFKYHVKTENIDLILTSVKKPLLEGGNIYTNLNSRDAHCYSLTNLKTEGTIKIENKLIKVKGKSWMDHQWANTNCPVNKWTWFSIQLDDKTEIVCFEYNDGEVKTRVASISYPNSKQGHNYEVKFTPLGMKWISPKTKAEYPLSWRIEIPAKNVNLKVKPLIKNQEMIFGTINYWEGPLVVKGLFNNKKVSGVGFLELVGYPSKYSNFKFCKDETKDIVIKSLSYIKKGTIKLIDNYRTRAFRRI
jgi:predicted secreted hydrolase